MTDAEARQGKYRDWTQEQREWRIGLLSRLVAKTVIANMGTALPREVFKRQLAEPMRRIEPELVPTEGDPYYMVFGNVLEGIDRACALWGVGRSDVEIVLAEQKGVGPRVRDAWRARIEQAGFQEPVFRSMQELAPLQAADMVAWFVRNYAEQGFANVRERHKALRDGKLIWSPIHPGHLARLMYHVVNEVIDRHRVEGSPPPTPEDG